MWCDKPVSGYGCYANSYEWQMTMIYIPVSTSTNYCTKLFPNEYNKMVEETCILSSE